MCVVCEWDHSQIPVASIMKVAPRARARDEAAASARSALRHGDCLLVVIACRLKRTDVAEQPSTRKSVANGGKLAVGSDVVVGWNIAIAGRFAEEGALRTENVCLQGGVGRSSDNAQHTHP